MKKAARVPEENARAARFLAELAAVTHDTAYTDAARRTWNAFGDDVTKDAFEAADWALAVRTTLAPEHPAPPAWQTALEQPTARKKSFSFKIRH